MDETMSAGISSEYFLDDVDEDASSSFRVVDGTRIDDCDVGDSRNGTSAASRFFPSSFWRDGPATAVPVPDPRLARPRGTANATAPSATTGEPPTRIPQPSSNSGKSKETGFVDKDGKRRAYDAPPPPAIEDIKWDRASDRMTAWSRHFARKAAYPRMDVEVEPMSLIINDDRSDDEATRGKPDPDFYSSDNVRHAVAEAEDLLRPLALIRDANGDPMRWSEDVERELAAKGIKLADSNVIDVNVEGEDGGPAQTISLGVRFFHLSYRYFVAAILGGDYGTYKTEFPVAGRPFVGFYYVALTVQEARVQRCP